MGLFGGYLGDTLLGYRGDIRGKSGDIWRYMGKIWGISSAYLGYIWGIPGGYLRHILRIPEAYLGDIWRMYFGGKIGDILGIS